jgi:hypothetical protein
LPPGWELQRNTKTRSAKIDRLYMLWHQSHEEDCSLFLMRALLRILCCIAHRQ